MSKYQEYNFASFEYIFWMIKTKRNFMVKKLPKFSKMLKIAFCMHVSLKLHKIEKTSVTRNCSFLYRIVLVVFTQL